MIDLSRHGGLALLVALGTALAGCTLNQLHQQELADQRRVDEKQALAAGEESRTRELAQQRQALTADLASRQLSLDETRARLARLLAANSHVAADNAALGAQQQGLLVQHGKLVEQVHATNVELTSLQSRGNPDDAERKARILFLKQQLDQQLDLLLH